MNNCDQTFLDYDETLVRLIDMTNQTCIVALDKTMSAVRRAPRRYAVEASYVSTVAERMVRAAFDVGMTLPLEQRACSR
jgi:hypothetical protein